MTNYAVDDEFGNQITTGLESYVAAKNCAATYLSAHKDASVTIYEDRTGGESWDLTREEVLGR